MRFTRTHSQSAWVVAVSLVVALASMLVAATALATAVPGIHAEQFSYDDVPLTYGSAVGVALNQDAEPRVSMVPVTRSEGSVARASDAVAHVFDSSVDLVAPSGAPVSSLPSPADAADLIRPATPVGSALKNDALHRAAVFGIDDVATNGCPRIGSR